MTFILKTTEHAHAPSPVGSDNEHCLYADIVSVSFKRHGDGTATAWCYMREPIKAAEVPGFCEVPKDIAFSGVAYLMNEAGKTVSTFTALSSGAGAPSQAASEFSKVERIDVDGFPRRSRVEYWSPGEAACDAAIRAIETAGAHPRLTRAQSLIGTAMDFLSDFIDSEPEPLRFKVDPVAISGAWRKKAIVVEAVRWNGATIGVTNGGTSIADELETGVSATERLVKPDWLPAVSDVREHDPHKEMPAPFTPVGEVHRWGDYLFIGTLEGVHRADPGDWIIRGVKGELYPCKPDIFAATYDRA